MNYENIISIRADGNYIHVNTLERTYTMKYSLRKLMEQLDKRFLQVQKAFIVNMYFIKRIDLASSEMIVNGHSIPIGRTYRDAILNAYEKEVF